MRDRLSVWLRRAHPVWFVLAVVAASFAVSLPQGLLSLLVPGLGIEIPAGMESHGILYRLVVGSVLVPPIETALFQTAIIGFLRRNTGLRYPLMITVSGGVFAASHSYSWAYVAFTLPAGLMFAYAYASRRRPGGRPFVLVSIAHGLHNAVAAFAI